MAKKQKLELTWIGKDERPRLEPRILLEDPELSYHAPKRVTENDIFDNMLIHGDNLLALKALEQDFAGKIKCIYIDPPFNTGQAFEHYDDGIEHSLWLSLMRDRLVILHKLLSDEGTFFVHIDDNEMAYLTVLLDEIFGRSNRLYIVTFKQGAAVGHKSINPGCVNTSNFILIYCKDKQKWTPNRIFTARGRDTRYNQFIENIEEHHSRWRISTLFSAFANQLSITEKQARQEVKRSPAVLEKFVDENSNSIIRLARPDSNAVSKEAQALIAKSKSNTEEIFYLERDGYKDFYFIRGERILFYRDKLKEIDGKSVAGEPLTTIWDDLLSNNLHNEGGVKFPKSKKPESLIKRVVELSTNPGDIVLDSFAGSGTTGAAAHKLGRRWIMVELGEHCEKLVLPRMKTVIDNLDSSGVTQATGWKGGGGFRYYRLAPSLLEKDKWGNWVVSKEYNPAMLAEAMCKLEGFEYAPNQDVFWMQGKSTETDYLYVTTQSLNKSQLRFISEQVGPNRSLLICCGAFRADTTEFTNLTVKKIPQAVLQRCEWGRDDYSLNVEELPAVEQAEEIQEEIKAAAKGEKPKPSRKKKPSAMQDLPLFSGIKNGGDK
ncbi:MAG: site-specific DNA-methyltransferase [Deltaproteobacteria bacterium]|nr:site-specific DNA-methyltransferase [Deltaproteobacteria bacterium]MBN2673661.1 site-specific DNA-methyltransferase [Deltaproteobacteria bacterium]